MTTKQINANAMSKEKQDVVYAFLYCCDIHESSYATMSLHKTLKGAEMAMEFHRNEAKKKHDEIYDRPMDVIEYPFGKSEDWLVKEFTIDD
jgi:hypothetical protein